MNSKKEEFLYMLLWGAETLARPTFRNITESFESWSYRSGLLRAIKRFEQCEWVESRPGATVERIYRLTEAGRVLALGGIDPETRWNRPWDRHWRLVAFDLPEKHNAARVQLRRYLRARRFGFLQKSLWVSPDPLDEDMKKLSALGQDVEAFITLEARPCSGESDASIVNGAWEVKQLRRSGTTIGFHEYHHDMACKPTKCSPDGCAHPVPSPANAASGSKHQSSRGSGSFLIRFEVEIARFI